MQPRQLVLSVRGLSKSYGDVRALVEVDFDIPRGQLIAVIGRSGSGKTTLIRCLNRLVEPTQGEIRFDGVDVSALEVLSLVGLEQQIYRRCDQLSGGSEAARQHRPGPGARPASHPL